MSARKAIEERPLEVGRRFPRLRSRIDTPAASDYAEAPDDTFAFGLDSLLDGLTARLPG
ncbi:TetR/AcrR family transcriptional regulator C-terminal domain-containing protein [Streptomyces sp. NPDC006553]|uniref:TetR/AcrR family transcriptional regulator C-terminal domain-containing protein n=1 Tax=unclassified Streptomyces TaxID=2593676 RepID=UPI00225856D9|nr:TetR/AcrR family transcriptional regulator C-terminal domain-containing protein [Streptomyces sp. NBC_00233]MCX5227191.1 TetR/AcrR family transcriptional regulator C-terminal domain-containing protein [Streptomyces sp. NBC_00233]